MGLTQQIKKPVQSHHVPGVDNNKKVR